MIIERTVKFCSLFILSEVLYLNCELLPLGSSSNIQEVVDKGKTDELPILILYDFRRNRKFI